MNPDIAWGGKLLACYSKMISKAGFRRSSCSFRLAKQVRSLVVKGFGHMSGGHTDQNCLYCGFRVVLMLFILVGLVVL